MPNSEIESEIYRYVADPGQALAYKIGELTILNLKKKYNGDIKKFHRLILENGVLPLDILIQKFKKMYYLYFFDLRIKSTGSLASTDFITIKDDIGSVQKANKNEILKSYISVRKQEYDELKDFVNKYELNEVTPLQVAGDDTIPGVYDPFGRNAFRNIRTIWYSA